MVRTFQYALRRGHVCRIYYLTDQEKQEEQKEKRKMLFVSQALLTSSISQALRHELMSSSKNTRTEESRRQR